MKYDTKFKVDDLLYRQTNRYNIIVLQLVRVQWVKIYHYVGKTKVSYIITPEEQYQYMLSACHYVELEEIEIEEEDLFLPKEVQDKTAHKRIQKKLTDKYNWEKAQNENTYREKMHYLKNIGEWEVERSKL